MTLVALFAVADMCRASSATTRQQQEASFGRSQLHPTRRNLDPLRRLAHRRRLFPAGDVRLGARLLWPERLCRRTAAAARLAGVADLVRHDVLLSVRRR